MRICIVGGGTAGWLAALMVSKVQGTSHEVVVVESSRIGIIGAGEGSTGYLTDIIIGTSYDYGCNEADFFRETNATVKLGIHHRDWRQKGRSYIAPIDTSFAQGLVDFTTLHAIANSMPFHLSSTNGYMIEHGKSVHYIDENGKINSTKGHAYHFDAHLVGRYFKKVCGNAVKHVDDEVVDVLLTENGFISSIRLASGQTMHADFFVDCTGFSRLFAKKLGIRWKSYSDNLPVNKAMPFLLDYQEGEEISPVTTAWAQGSGWMWQIPTQTRKGCGYVYCGDFVTDDQAHREIELSLGRKVDPIRVLEFDTGRLERLWTGNCLFLGLCAAFAEPLEATSIHSTIVQLQTFIFGYLKDSQEETCNPGSISFYNKRMSRMYDDFRDFLNLHYMTNRNDTDFWKWMSTGETATDRTRDILSMQKHRTLQAGDIDSYHGYAGAGLYNWILAGLGHLGPDLARRELAFFGDTDRAGVIWNIHQKNLANMAKSMINNTELVRNTDKYFHGHNIP